MVPTGCRLVVVVVIEFSFEKYYEIEGLVAYCSNTDRFFFYIALNCLLNRLSYVFHSCKSCFNSADVGVEVIVAFG